jgi:hypothetical protein
MTEHDRDHASQNDGHGDTHRRGRTITGLSDLLPDWLLSPEGKQHARNARKEALLVVRSVLDAAIARQEAGPAPRRSVSKVEID